MNKATKKYTYPPRHHFWVSGPSGQASTIYVSAEDYERLAYYAFGSKRVLADAARQAALNVLAKGFSGSFSAAVVDETEAVLAADYQPGRKYVTKEIESILGIS